VAITVLTSTKGNAEIDSETGIGAKRRARTAIKIMASIVELRSAIGAIVSLGDPIGGTGTV